MEWSEAEIYKLINLYRQFECLWNYKSPTYKRTDLKINAWKQMGKELKKDSFDVKKKVRHLRTAYLAEKKKVDASKKSGSSIDGIYESQLFYFKEMGFLDSVVSLRKTCSNLNTKQCNKYGTWRPTVIKLSVMLSLCYLIFFLRVLKHKQQ